jgi:hypothetical protein
VASISRSSPSGYGGTYYISFSNPTANNQYAVTASAGRGQANNAVGGVAIFQYQAGGTSPPSTSGFYLSTYHSVNGVIQDADYVSFVVHGN